MLKCLIFDMDGTLSNSDPVHMQAFRDYLQPEGILVDDDFYRTRISGRTNAAIFSELFPGRPESEIEQRAHEKEAMFRSRAATLERLAGLDALLDLAGRRGLRLAVVTNGPRLNLDHMVEQLGLAGRFEVHLAREDVAVGKPDPLPYRTALERLGVTAAEAVAFEDSPAGIVAAKGAGLFTYGLLTGHDGEALARAGADRVIRDFADPALWRDLETRLGRG
jgi:HAD superfamily hydrolase (TIGR01509 family)